MASYSTSEIRNVTLVGHQSCGKTSLADAILHVTGTTNRLGDVNAKTSYLDFLDEEKTRACSIDTALIHVTVKGKALNVVDAPGAPDFVGPAIASLAGVETAICVISATAGIEVNTRRMMERAKQYGLGRVIVINKIDANLDLEELIAGIQELFGQECRPFNLPAAKGTKLIDCFTDSSGSADFGDVGEAHTALIERIVEADEKLMEQYLETGEMAPERLVGVIGKAIATGSVVPILFTAARSEIGVRELLDFIADYCPSPLDGKQRVAVSGESSTEIKPDPKAPFIGQVFKVFADPRSNIKFSVCRILSGSIKSDASIHIGEERKPVRPGPVVQAPGRRACGSPGRVRRRHCRFGQARHQDRRGAARRRVRHHRDAALPPPDVLPRHRAQEPQRRRQGQRRPGQVHRRRPLLRGRTRSGHQGTGDPRNRRPAPADHPVANDHLLQT